ncbi:Aminopeptidase N [Pseudolycoriella hygida]|uniref:Aminopeptidase n=1 Tax=Pseudolycoriella hygida TaxID=35572 RepID=A0A9Q0MPH1_9DIPT|nr:Aminopeptidase N [Pseudolycoriella hygida]
MLYLLFAILLFTTPVFPQSIDSYRLPNNTRPETYDLTIRTWIDDGNSTFTGSVRIGIVAIESTSYIRLHQNVLNLENITVLSWDEVPIAIGEYSISPEHEFLTIPLIGSNLTQGLRYFIDIDYVGTMNSFSGFYRSFYDIGATRFWFGSTQFEATYARTAFPCYDEPFIKSNFTIRITHADTYAALSNMPVKSVTPNTDGSVTTEFETAPPISTYLIAFHVSNFPHISSSPVGTVPQRVFSRSTVTNATGLALESSELLLEALSEYIGVEYSLPKLDHVAVPGEFFSLFDGSVDFFTRKLEAILTISHEVSHQWFGNLEGFATLFEYFGVDLIYPDWQMMDYFVVDIMQSVFLIDSDERTEPMTFYIEHPIDIDFHFNSIAYSKAAAVLRMFWLSFGENTFVRGLKSYLEDNAYSDATEELLFEALGESLKLEAETIIPPNTDVSTIMASWTRQAGFPLITVLRNYDDRTDQVTLQQERFYSFPPPDRENTTWWVPYSLLTPLSPGFDNTRPDGWIPQNNTSSQIIIDSLSSNDFLLINKQAAGYYRVLYDARNYRLISDAIIRNASQFHSTNIAQLMGDVLEFYRTRRIPITPVLDLLRVLEFRSDFVSWNLALSSIYYINQNFMGHRNYLLWEGFIRGLTEQIYDSIGVEDIEDEPILRKFSRESIVFLACQMGSVHCRSDANRQLRLHLETGAEFHHNIRHTLMCASLRSASRTEFHSMWNRLRSLPLDNFSERAEIIDWLGCSTSRNLLREFVRSSINSTNSNNFEYSYFEQYSVFTSIVRNSRLVGLDVLLDFLNENAIEAFHTYGQWFVQALAFAIRSEQHAEQFLNFQKILLDAGLMIQGEINFNMQQIAVSLQWLDTEGEVVSDWLLENFT